MYCCGFIMLIQVRIAPVQIQISREGQVKSSFIVIQLHVGTNSGTKRCASQDHGAT